jgi:hypothetical protein
MLLLLVVDEWNTSEKWVARTQLSVAYVIVILEVSKKKTESGEYVNHSSLFFLLSRTVKDQQEMHASTKLLDGVIIGRENVGRYI